MAAQEEVSFLSPVRRTGSTDAGFRDLLWALSAEFERLTAANATLAAENDRFRRGGDGKKEEVTKESRSEKRREGGRKDMRKEATRDEKEEKEEGEEQEGVEEVDENLGLEADELPPFGETQTLHAISPSSPAETRLPPAAVGRAGGGLGSGSSNGASPTEGAVRLVDTVLDREWEGLGNDEADHFERMRTMQAEFRDLCHEGEKTIPPEEVLKMRRRIEGVRLYDFKQELHARLRYRNALEIFNRAADITSFPPCNISAQTYAKLVQGKAALIEQLIPDQSVRATLREIRIVLIRNATMRQIKLATNMDVGQSSKSLGRRSFNPEQFFQMIDSVMSVIILANAVIIGVSLDYAVDWDGWTYIEGIFLFAFLLELLVKNAMQGLASSYFGEDWLWNWFDGVVVICSVADFIAGLTGRSSGNLSAVAAMRLLRFAKLGRLVRVLRMRTFKDVQLLISGCVMGLRTLFWVVILLGYFCYIVGVLARLTVGSNDPALTLCEDPNGGGCSRNAATLERYRLEMFGSMSRAMFTVFRCFVDGSSSVDGTPLPPYLFDNYGAIGALIFIGITLFIRFGFFNLIAAVFVETTLENAKLDEIKRREARQAEQLRTARKLEELIVSLCADDASVVSEPSFHWPWPVGKRQSKAQRKKKAAEQELSARITSQTFNQVLKRPLVKNLLTDLDITAVNAASLFEVLDSNQNGVLEVKELIQGLLKLRSGGEKNDLVAILLSAQSLRKSVNTVEMLCLQQYQAIAVLTARLDAVTRAEADHHGGQGVQEALMLTGLPHSSPEALDDYERPKVHNSLSVEAMARRPNPTGLAMSRVMSAERHQDEALPEGSTGRQPALI